jgi:hypothetical protein
VIAAQVQVVFIVNCLQHLMVSMEVQPPNLLHVYNIWMACSAGQLYRDAHRDSGISKRYPSVPAATMTRIVEYGAVFFPLLLDEVFAQVRLLVRLLSCVQSLVTLAPAPKRAFSVVVPVLFLLHT